MKFKSLFKYLMYAAVTCVVLFVIAGITLKIMLPADKVKAELMPLIEDAVGRKIILESAGVTIFPILGIKLEGLEIANTNREGFSKDPFIKLKAFILKINLRTLIQFKLSIGKIIFDNPEILIEVDKNGDFNFSDLAFMTEDSESDASETTTESSSMPISLSLDKFALKNATIIYHDRQIGDKIVLKNVNQEASINMGQDMEILTTKGKMILKNISMQSKDLPSDIKNIKVTLNHDLVIDLEKSKIEIKELRASLQKIYISLYGSVENFDTTPNLKLTVKTEKIMVEDILKEISPEMMEDIKKLKGTGSFKLELTVRGKVDEKHDPKIKGNLNIDNVEVKYTDLNKSFNNFNADINFTDNSLDIKKLTLNVGNDPISLSGVINDFDKPNVNLVFSAKLNLSDLKDVMELGEGESYAGMVDANIKARGVIDPNNLRKIKVNGKIIASKVRIQSPPLTKPLNINGKISFTPKSVKLDYKVKIASSSINLDGSLINYLTLFLDDNKKKYPRAKLTFDLSSSNLNLDEFIDDTDTEDSSDDESMPAGDASDGPIMTDPLPAMDIVGTIKAKKITYSKIDLNFVCIETMAEYQIVNIFHIDIHGLSNIT